MSFFSHVFGALRDGWSYRHEPERFELLAERFWHVLIITTMLLILAIAAYGTIRFTSILYEKPAEVLLTGNNAPFDEEALKKTISGFDQRRTNYAARLENALQIADPSK